MTDRQLITAVITVAVCTLADFQTMYPDHSVKAREIAKLQEDLQALCKKSGTRILSEADVDLGVRAYHAAMNVFKEAARG